METKETGGKTLNTAEKGQGQYDSSTKQSPNSPEEKLQESRGR